jgi:hypothetical protein
MKVPTIFMKEMSVSDMITIFATLVLGSILLVVVLAMLVGLFITKESKDDIFSLISPAFQTIVGAFVGLISGIHLGKQSSEKKEEKKEELPPTTTPTAP